MAEDEKLSRTEKWAKKKKKQTTSKDLPPGRLRSTAEKIEERRRKQKEFLDSI